MTNKDHADAGSVKEYSSDKLFVRGETVQYLVPGKILGFLVGRSRAHVVLHSCDSTCTTNSLLTRRWSLLGGRPEVTRKRGEEPPPVYLVDLEQLCCPIFVVEENPGFDETGDDPSRLFVHEVRDRKHSWGRLFLECAHQSVKTFFSQEISVDHDGVFSGTLDQNREDERLRALKRRADKLREKEEEGRRNGIEIWPGSSQKEEHSQGTQGNHSQK